MLKKIRNKWRKDAIAQARRETIANFTVIREKGVDYITFCGVRITTEQDNNEHLLDRLEKLREYYLESKMEQIQKDYAE